MPKLQIVLGVDIGGTNTKFGYVDKDGRCLAGTSMQTDADQPADHFFARLQEHSKALLESIEEECDISPRQNADGREPATPQNI